MTLAVNQDRPCSGIKHDQHMLATSLGDVNEVLKHTEGIVPSGNGAQLRLGHVLATDRLHGRREYIQNRVLEGALTYRIQKACYFNLVKIGIGKAFSLASQ